MINVCGQEVKDQGHVTPNSDLETWWTEASVLTGPLRSPIIITDRLLYSTIP